MSVFDKIRNKALDADGQPLNRWLSRSRIATRQIDEMIGICRGVIADGALVDSEVVLLARWLQANRECADQWPATVLIDRLARALADGVIDDDEERELLELLDSTIGGPLSEDGPDSSRLPYSDPMPKIHFHRALFVVTGKFAYGPRTEVMKAIRSRGGDIAERPTQDTDFLVVGLYGSRDWLHSTHGTKILKARELRDDGHKIEIVSEEHWHAYVTG